MEELKRIAVNSYKKNIWSDAEKQRFENYFRNLDSDGDEKVSFEELRSANVISDDLLYVFSTLDANGNGLLDYEEAMALYFYKYVVPKTVRAYEPSKRFCKGLCLSLQARPDFSCFACLSKKLRRSYHLCSRCHGKGVHLKHKHPKWYMLSRQALDVLHMMKFLLFDDYNINQLDKESIEIAAAKTSMASSYVAMTVALGTPALTAALAAVGSAGACTIM